MQTMHDATRRKRDNKGGEDAPEGCARGVPSAGAKQAVGSRPNKPALLTVRGVLSTVKAE